MALAPWFSFRFNTPQYAPGNLNGQDGWTQVSGNPNVMSISTFSPLEGDQSCLFDLPFVGNSGRYERFLELKQADYEVSFLYRSTTTTLGRSHIGLRFGPIDVWEIRMTGDTTVEIKVVGQAPTVIASTVEFNSLPRIFKIVVKANGNWELFIGGVSQHTTTTTIVDADKIFFINDATGGSATFGFIDAIIGLSFVATNFELNFEPPDYTLTGGPGSTPDVEGQDDWVKLLGTTNSMEITSDVAKVLGETQSLLVHVDPAFLDSGDFATRYKRPIPRQEDYVIQWAWKFTTAPDPSSSVVFVAPAFSDIGLVWFVRFFGPNSISIGVTGGGFQLATTTIDHTVSHTFKVVSVTQGARSLITFYLDGSVVFVAQTITPPKSLVNFREIDRIILLMLPGFGTTSEFILDNVISQPITNVARIKAPEQVFAISRSNYTVIKWRVPVADTNGNPLPSPITKFLLSRATLINESDLELIAIIDSIDANGEIDTAFVDTNPSETLVYRVQALTDDDSILISELSDPAVAVRTFSQIDEKEEIIDKKLLLWDEGNWDETLWV